MLISGSTFRKTSSSESTPYLTLIKERVLNSQNTIQSFIFHSFSFVPFTLFVSLANVIFL